MLISEDGKCFIMTPFRRKPACVKGNKGQHKLDVACNKQRREEAGSRRECSRRTRRFGAKEEDSDNNDDRTDGLKQSRESPAPGGVEPVAGDDGEGNPCTRCASNVEKGEETARGN